MNNKIEEVRLTTSIKILEVNKYIFHNNIERSKKKVIPVKYQEYLAFIVKYLVRRTFKARAVKI